MSRRKDFYVWLMKQAERDDPIGDVARDAKRDPDAPRYAFRLKTWRQHLKNNNACKEAIEALAEAFKEFAEYNTRGNN